MANVQISQLAPVILPIDAANTFLEVQAIEGGIDVSRKIAAADLTISATITIEDEGVPLAGSADTLNFVGAGVTASGAGSTKTITIPGVSDPLTVGRAILTNTNDPDLVDTTVALNVGSADPDNNAHIEFGPTFIQQKQDATTVDSLGIQPLGGDLDLGDQTGGSGGDVRLYRNAVVVAQTDDSNLGVLSPGNGDPTVPDAVAITLSFRSQDQNEYGRIDFGSGDPGDMLIRNLAESAALGAGVEQGGGGFVNIWAGNEDSMDLFDPLNDEARFGTGVVSITTGMYLQGSTVNNPATGGVQDQQIEFRNSGVQPTFDMGFAASADFGMNVRVHGGQFVIRSEDTGGTLRTGFALDPDANTTITGDTGVNIFVVAGLEQAIGCLPNAQVDLYHNNVATARTALAASGGLEANNLSTGAGFERVLTTSDLGGGGAPTNATYVVISLDATLTDERVLTAGNGITLTDGGAGGNATIDVDQAFNFVFSGSCEFTNVGGLELGPSCELDCRNTADDSTTFIQNLGSSFQFGVAGADFGTQIFDISQSSFAKVNCPPLFIGEQAAGETNVAGDGQLWVRNDTPSTLMYQDDAGNDFTIPAEFVEQLADDTVNNTTTLAATELQFANIPAGWYRIDMMILARDVAVSGCGLRVDITVTGAGSNNVMRFSNKNFAGAGAPSYDEIGLVTDLFDGIALVTGSGTSRFLVTGYVEFISGTNTFEVEFAQDTAQVGDLDFEAGSFCSLTKMGNS